jgi:molybdate transport system permease protein
VALLLVFGRRGLIGSWAGFSLAFTTTGVVLAESFVAMPFLVVSVEGALRAADRRYEEAAATLGATRWTVFRRVTLPLIAPGLAAGTVLCWARALGEFGATITFAGNLPGRTQTMPIAVYLALESDPGGAIVLSLVLLAVSVAVLVALRDRWLG